MAVKRINLRDSQLQARLGLIISSVSVVLTFFLAFLVLQNFNPTEKTIGYNPEGWRFLLIAAATGLACLLGAFGFGLGFTSLGHKRNARQRESWLGLVLGPLGACLAIILFYFFRLFALAIVT